MQQQKLDSYSPSCASVVTPEILLTAHSAADAAADIIRSYFRKPASVSFKPDETPVTVADKEAEEAMRTVISAAFPTHAILGEESGSSSSQSKYTWILDPIDGTKAFMAGRATFGTLIALAYDGFPVLGIIDQCIMKERWVGIPGQTTLNDQRVTVSAGSPLKDCTVHATTPEMFQGLDFLTFGRVKRAVKDVVYGSDCYAYALLATGCVEAIVESDLKVWDFAALVPVVEGAGGKMTDWYGNELSMESEGSVVAAATEDMHMELVGLLSGEEMEKKMAPECGVVSEPFIPAVDGNGLPPDPGPGHVESMTGYGEKIVREGDIEVTASLRSVNSRYCDVQIKGPRSLSNFDAQLAAMVRHEVARGKVAVTVDVSVDKGMHGNGGGLPVVVDIEAARTVRRLLDDVANAAGLRSEPTLSDVLGFSEVLVRKDTRAIADHMFEVVKRAVSEAIDDLRATRRREGAILQEDLLKRTRKIRGVLKDVEARAPKRVEREKTRLQELTKDIGIAELNERRLETEITLFADRADITEEIVRLDAHVRMFEMTLFGAHEPIGQRLSFLLHEMHREATTIGSKASDATIAHLAVLIKEEIEKIREQCQNIR